MNFETLSLALNQVSCDVLILPIFEDEDVQSWLASQLGADLLDLIEEVKANREWKAEEGSFLMIHRPSGMSARRLLMAGAGPSGHYDSQTIRSLLQHAIVRIQELRFESVAFVPRDEVEAVETARAAVEGFVLGLYDAGEYKSQDRLSPAFSKFSLVLQSETLSPAFEALINRARVLGEATNLARSLTHEPGNRLGPKLFSEKISSLAESTGLDCEILDEAEIEKLGMNALLAVASGSAQPACFVVLKHLKAADAAEPPVVWIGKGVTFDSGGLSLKPSQSMEEMKSDKAGACSVLAALIACARLEVPVNLIGLIPIVENLPGGRALRPGDVVLTMAGKTVEVINTDAEGRLILADSLAYARRFNPKYIIDIATLTGACVVALGQIRAGLFSNNESLAERILRASETSGERVWRLPLDKDYRKQLDSLIADLRNVGSRWGGAITAAKFLQEFVDVPWCHVDIAGVDVYPEGNEVKGPTGFGVRLLLESLEV